MRTHPVAFDSGQAGGPGEATSALRAVKRELGTGRGQRWLCRGATGATLTWGPGGPRSPDFPGLPVSPCGENGIFEGLGSQKRHLFIPAQPGFGGTTAECHQCHSRRHRVCQEVPEVPGDPSDPAEDKEVAVSGSGGWQCPCLGAGPLGHLGTLTAAPGSPGSPGLPWNPWGPCGDKVTSAGVAPAGSDSPKFEEGGDTYRGAGGAGGAAGSHGALEGHTDVTQGRTWGGDTPEATTVGEPPKLGVLEWGPKWD